MSSDTPRMPASYDTDISREPDNTEATLEHARQIGAEHGRGAAGWAFDGNTTAETYRRVLRGIEDGDPEVMDAYDNSIPRLDQASDYTLADLAADLDFTAEDERGTWADPPGLSEAENAYYDAAGSAFWHEVERIARSHVKPLRYYGIDPAGAYTVGSSPGVAWRVVSADVVDGMVTAVMIGDDRETPVDVADLTPIGDDDYCGGCGQTGHNFC